MLKKAGIHIDSFADNQFNLFDEADITKIINFDVGTNVPTGTTNVYQFPSAAGVLALADASDGTLDATYLKLDGSNADQTIDLGSEGLVTSGGGVFRSGIFINDNNRYKWGDGTTWIEGNSSTHDITFKPNQVERVKLTDTTLEMSVPIDMGDKNITGIDTLAFTDINGTIAGIENQNLLDKTVAEIITARWTFDAGIKLNNSDTILFGTNDVSDLSGNNQQTLWNFDTGGLFLNQQNDATVLTVQGHSTQTNDLLNLQQDDTTVVTVIDNDGNAIFGNGVSGDSGYEVDDGTTVKATFGFDDSEGNYGLYNGIILAANLMLGLTSNELIVYKDLVLPKTSGIGLKVDTATPTFGFADILGDQFSKNTGATKPTLTVYNGVINGWLFGVSDEAYISYHIPHDYVPNSEIFLHIHWSHTGTLVTGGTVTFKATSIYAKSHDQAPFQSTPSTGTFTGTASTIQYQHILSESSYSASSPTGIQIDQDNIEPDGVIELTFEVDANNLTVSGGGVPDVFVHFVDIHYQTTGIIGTKDKAPDFYT